MKKAMAGLLAVCLVLAGSAAIGTQVAPAGKKKATITVGNNFFAPAKKRVKRNTLVKFKWDGGVPHNVTKRKGPAGKIKSKTTSKSGVNFRKRFKRRGKYKFVCTIHPASMKLTLKVR